MRNDWTIKKINISKLTAPKALNMFGLDTLDKPAIKNTAIMNAEKTKAIERQLFSLIKLKA